MNLDREGARSPLPPSARGAMRPGRRVIPIALAASLLLAALTPGKPLANPAAEPPATTPSAPSGGSSSTSAPATKGEERLKILGLQLDAGAPDGLAFSVIYRPWYFLRLNAGPAYNLIGFGIQGGATLIPFHFPITPTLTGEAGYFFSGNLNRALTRWNVSVPSAVQPLLDDVGYTYLSTQLGVEFGAPEVFVFYIRFGLAWVFPSVHGTATTTSDSTTVTVNGVQGRVATPTANLGFVVYIW